VVSIGQVHLALAIFAMATGAIVVGMKKGTVTHRLVGFVYAMSMFGLNGTAFLLYRLFGGFGPFHVAALMSLVTIVFGIVHVLLRKPKGKWIEAHAYWMSWSYVGLLAAAASEILTRVPESSFWWMVVGATLLVVAIGRQLIKRNVPRILKEFGR